MRNERRTRVRLGAVLLSVLAVMNLVSPGAASADTCEIPLSVQQGLNGANVMILADNSGSMNAATYSMSYDPSVTWSGNFNTNSDYFISRDGTYEPSDFNWRWPGSPSAKLVNSDNGQSGRYQGNYLNWVFFHATDIERALIPQVTRIQILKSILQTVVQRSARLNFGLTIFDRDDGGHVVAPCGIDKSTLNSTIANLTANTWTPLGESLETVLDYFSESGDDAPIQVACQYSFCVVVTDGLPTMDIGVSNYLHDADGDGNDPGSCTSLGAPYSDWNECSDHFDDVAYYMNHNDLRSDLDDDQTVSTYVVGYNEDAPLLADAAANGGGLYFHADNAVELYLSIEHAIQDILRRISAGSAVAVVSTEQGTDDRMYRGKFMPIDWNGFMECYALPYSEGDHAVWEAGELLRQRGANSRNIFTALGTTIYDFTPGNAANLRDKLGADNDTEAEMLISWGRGNPNTMMRDRQDWILGPIIHSTPVVVGAPSDYLPTEAYQSFRQANQYRRKMVYVGANDGMLHAFDAQSGEEAWAFVPEFALPSFKVMADSFYCHKFSVDQTPSVKDMEINGSWRTVLVTGGRQGGHSIFAMDITYPDSPDLLWQADLPNGKNYNSNVEITTIDGEAIVLVGSGLDDTDGEAYLYAYRLRDGNRLASIRISDDGSHRNKATAPMAVDRDLDGSTDLVYIADLLGNVYRFECNESPDPDDWHQSTLFDGHREITADPTTAFGPNGAVYVYFGTGAFLEEGDMADTTEQSFVCVFDVHDRNTADINDLKNQTSSIRDLDNASGWYVDLKEMPGERITQTSAVVAETVIFTSFAPDPDACVAGGRSFLYQMRYDDGSNAEDQEDEDDRVQELGDGIASYPVVDLSAGTVVVQASDASISVAPIAAMIQRMNLRSWQENYDHVQEAPENVQ